MSHNLSLFDTQNIRSLHEIPLYLQGSLLPAVQSLIILHRRPICTLSYDVNITRCLDVLSDVVMLTAHGLAKAWLSRSSGMSLATTVTLYC